jgi:hypothetical protein
MMLEIIPSFLTLSFRLLSLSNSIQACFSGKLKSTTIRPAPLFSSFASKSSTLNHRGFEPLALYKYCNTANGVTASPCSWAGRGDTKQNQVGRWKDRVILDPLDWSFLSPLSAGILKKKVLLTCRVLIWVINSRVMVRS